MQKNVDTSLKKGFQMGLKENKSLSYVPNTLCYFWNTRFVTSYGKKAIMDRIVKVGKASKNEKEKEVLREIWKNLKAYFPVCNEKEIHTKLQGMVVSNYLTKIKGQQYTDRLFFKIRTDWSLTNSSIPESDKTDSFKRMGNDLTKLEKLMLKSLED